MTDSTPAYQRFFAELKRRRVFRVAAVYGAVGFGVLQLAEILVPVLELPPAVMRGIVLVLFLGFPVAIVLAWAFEKTPDGMKRTESAASGEIEAIASESILKRWTPGLAAVAGTVLLLVGGWWIFGGEPDRGRSQITGDQPLDDSVLAILPFGTQVSPGVEYLGEGLVSLLSTAMDGAGDIRAVDSGGMLRVASRDGYTPGDPASAVRLASAFGAGLYVVGDIVEAGGRMQISATLNRVGDAKPLGEASAEGTADDVFEMVDELTAELLSGLQGGPAARVQRIAGVTTSSLSALKAFLEGEGHFQRGQFAAGVESFRRAAQEDSLFALAHYRLSIAAEWNFQSELSLAAAEQAVRFSDRLAERDQRLLSAFLTRRRGANAEAAVQYRSILGTYPDEMEAWLDLSEVLFHANPLYGRSFTESRETLTRVLEFDPNFSTGLIHLVRVAAYEGDAAAVDSISRKLLDLDPDPGRNLEVATMRAIGMRDSTALRSVVERFSAGDELGVALSSWVAAMYGGDIETAGHAARALTEARRSPEARRLGYAWLAHIAAARGQYGEADALLAELSGLSEGTALEYEALLANLPFVTPDEAKLRELVSRLERLDPQSIETSTNPSALFTAHDPLHALFRAYLLGHLSARLGEAEAAETYAADLTAMPPGPTEGSLPVDMGRSIRVEVLRGQGRLIEALALIQENRSETWYAQTTASPLFCQIRERFVRAELLRELGRTDEAEEWYSTIGQLSPFSLPYKAFSQFRLAEIRDARGDREGAAEAYAAFVEFWNDADADRQDLVKEAKARLAELRTDPIP